MAREYPSDFKLMQKLAGTWVGTAKHGEDEPHPATVTYSVTAGGSAVVETMFVGTEHEMVTVYFLDGHDITLTHYCMLGNQPEMKLQPDDDPKVLSFVCTEAGSNIANENVPHMHAAKMIFEGDDHLVAHWTLHKQGQAASSAHIELHRQVP